MKEEEAPLQLRPKVKYEKFFKHSTHTPNRPIAPDIVYDEQVEYMTHVKKPTDMNNSQFRAALDNIEKAMRRLPRTDGNPNERVYSEVQIHKMLHDKQPKKFQTKLGLAAQNYKLMDTSALVTYFDRCQQEADADAAEAAEREGKAKRQKLDDSPNKCGLSSYETSAMPAQLLPLTHAWTLPAGHADVKMIPMTEHL
jgi:hypothetical protein